MALTEAQKRAQKKYYEKNREKLLAYKSKYWQLNKHKYSSQDKTLRDRKSKDASKTTTLVQPEGASAIDDTAKFEHNSN